METKQENGSQNLGELMPSELPNNSPRSVTHKERMARMKGEYKCRHPGCGRIFLYPVQRGRHEAYAHGDGAIGRHTTSPYTVRKVPGLKGNLSGAEVKSMRRASPRISVHGKPIGRPPKYKYSWGDVKPEQSLPGKRKYTRRIVADVPDPLPLQDSHLNFCPCCGTSLRGVKMALNMTMKE